jgi:type VI secretion system secreted protein VgrG
LVTAYDYAAGLAPTQVLTGEDLGGLTLTPGVYFFASSAGLTGNLTLNGEGNPDGVFVFQIGSTLTTASSSEVVLENAAQAGNVFWQVGSSATLGTGTSFDGTILADTSITLDTGANLTGSLLAMNGAVTLDGNDVTTAVAEPGTLLLLGVGLAVFFAFGRRFCSQAEQLPGGCKA